MNTCLLTFIAGFLALALMGCHSRLGPDKASCRVVEAAYSGNLEQLIYELSRGCDPRGSTDHVNEPIFAGIVLGKISIVETLLDAGICPSFDWGERGGDLLNNAVQFGHNDIVILLVKRGANVNRSIGHSALFNAIIHGHQEIEAFLKSVGAELNNRDKEALDRHPFLRN